MADPVSLEFTMVQMKGKLPFLGSKIALGPDELHTYTEISFKLPISFDDWRMLDESTGEGYHLVITPVKQQLPFEDTDADSWALPGDPDGPADGSPRSDDGNPGPGGPGANTFGVQGDDSEPEKPEDSGPDNPEDETPEQPA